MDKKPFTKALTSFKKKVLRSSDNAAFKKQICDIVTDCEIFLSDWRKNDKEIISFISDIRNKLLHLAKNKEYSEFFYGMFYDNEFYALLLEAARLSPYNNVENEKATSPCWVCPISDKSTACYHISNEFIILSNGYLYDKESLFTWFKKSKRFIDPVTREQLPQFDVDRILRLNQGLEQIAEIQRKFNTLKSDLIAKQEKMFSSSYLSYREAIKKHFLVLSSNAADRDSKMKSNQEIQILIKKHVEQKPAKIIGKKELSNFSNLDLSGLAFYNHHLVSPYVGEGVLDLRGANLSGCYFLGTCSTGECLHADLSQANLEGAKFANLPGHGLCIKTTDFSNANLRNVDFTGVGNWGEVNITNANLKGAYLFNDDGVKLTGPDLKKRLQNLNGVESAMFDPVAETQAACVKMFEADVVEESKPGLRR